MSTDVLVAYSMMALPVLLICFLNGAVAWYVVQMLKRWKASAAATVDGGVFQALLFAVVLDVILLAGMNVGQFFELWTEGWPGIVATVTAIFMPWLGFKAAGKFAAAKGGSAEIGGGQ